MLSIAKDNYNAHFLWYAWVMLIYYNGKNDKHLVVGETLKLPFKKESSN